MPSRRLHLAILAAACLVISAFAGSSADAQTRRIIVPYTPGSGPDILARLMSEQIGAQNGPNMVVENRPGGGTAIGTEVAARAEPDGNTVLQVANAFAVNAALKRGNYDVAKSFEPICQLASTPMMSSISVATLSGSACGRSILFSTGMTSRPWLIAV